MTNQKTKRLMRNLSNKELVVMAQAGNQRAIGILFEKTKKPTQITLRRSFESVSFETIEDVTQNALIKAFQNLNKYNATFSFNTWVCTIARNSMIDHLRRKDVRVKETSLDQDFTASDEGEESHSLIHSFKASTLNPEELMENYDKGVFAKKLMSLDVFSDEIRNVVNLRFVKEMSYDEITKETGIPLGTVKARLHRFRKIVGEKVTIKEKNSVYQS